MSQSLTKEMRRPFLFVQPSQLMSSVVRLYSGVDQAFAVSCLFKLLSSLVAMKAKQFVQFNPQNAIDLPIQKPLLDDSFLSIY